MTVAVGLTEIVEPAPMLVSGKPLEEPVAWYGPVVMNTQQQLREAFDEIEKGTFLKR